MGTFPSYDELDSIDTDNDLLLLVDVDDTSMSPEGTTKNVTITDLISGLVLDGGTASDS